MRKLSLSPWIASEVPGRSLLRSLILQGLFHLPGLSLNTDVRMRDTPCHERTGYVWLARRPSIGLASHSERLAKRRGGYTMLPHFHFDHSDRRFSLMSFAHKALNSQQRFTRLARAIFLYDCAAANGVRFAGSGQAAAADITSKLDGFDAYMEQSLKDWNAPGIGVGIVVERQAGVREGLRLSRLREEAAVHAGHALPDRVEHEAVHRGRGGHARRRRQADLGQAGARVGADHAASTTISSTTP